MVVAAAAAFSRGEIPTNGGMNVQPGGMVVTLPLASNRHRRRQSRSGCCFPANPTIVGKRGLPTSHGGDRDSACTCHPHHTGSMLPHTYTTASTHRSEACSQGRKSDRSSSSSSGGRGKEAR